MRINFATRYSQTVERELPIAERLGEAEIARKAVGFHEVCGCA